MSFTSNSFSPAIWGTLFLLLAGIVLSGCESAPKNPDAQSGGGFTMGYSSQTSISDREWR